jgi:hypothetical protein
MKKEYSTPKELRTTSKAIDYSGTHLGKLEIMYPIEREFPDSTAPNKSHLRWLALCECGNQVSIRAKNIQADKIRSCGQCEYEDPRAAKFIKEIPYKWIDDEGNEYKEEQMSLDLSEDTDTCSKDEPLDAVMDILEPEIKSSHGLEAELEGIQACCTAIEAIPEEAHRRVMKYLNMRYVHSYGS